MAKHTLTMGMLLLLTVVIRGEPLIESDSELVHTLHPQETSSSASVDINSSTLGESRIGGPVNVGDRTHELAGGGSVGISPTIHDTSYAGDDTAVTWLPKETSTHTPSAPVLRPLASFDEDTGSTLRSSGSTSSEADIETLLPLEDIIPQASSPSSASNDFGQTTASPAFLSAVGDDSSYLYSAGTVEPSEKRAAIEEVTRVKSSALSLSSTQEQPVDVSHAVSSPTVSPSSPTTMRATETSPSSSTSPNDNKTKGEDQKVSSTSSGWKNSPIFYAVVAVALAGLAAAIVTFHKRSVRARWSAAIEASVVTPDLPRTGEWRVVTAASNVTPVVSRTTWDPSLSEVRVVINDQANFAIL